MISVIIPCYNSGEFLRDALESVLELPDVEIVVVDDGSTDPYTRDYLAQISKEGINVIYQENKGPAAARNTAVKSSNGDYLLFLDSDNKIKPEYITKAMAIHTSHAKVGVVYAKPIFFGDSSDEESRYETLPFHYHRLLIGNYIDMCSIVKRQVWDDVGGFDESKDLRGCEDWDFWVRIAGAGWQFHLLDEALYYYRIRNNSVSTSVVGDHRSTIVDYFSRKHHAQIFKGYKYYARLHKKIQQKPFLYFLKIIYSKYILRKDYLP